MAVARTRVGKGLADETEHRSLGISGDEPNLSQGPGDCRGHYHSCRLDLVLALQYRQPARAVSLQLHVAPGQGRSLGAPEPAVGQHPDDG